MIYSVVLPPSPAWAICGLGSVRSFSHKQTFLGYLRVWVEAGWSLLWVSDRDVVLELAA